MVYSLGVKGQNNIKNIQNISFGKKEERSKSKCENKDAILAEEHAKHPIGTGLKINTEKLFNAFTKYPKKGMEGSKNANFYEFLTMGSVPYIIGSLMMMAVFNFANRYFDTPSSVNASKLGKKMALGVVAYGILKNISKKFIELPVKYKYGIDVNLPYKKIINELPEENNKDNLVTHEYHKVFESVDFPRWDLLYDNKYYGDKRNGYFEKIAEKYGYKEGELDYSDQKMKSKIKETVTKTKLFSTLSSYLWAATGVGIALQKPWESMVFNPKQRITNLKNHIEIAKIAKEQGRKIAKYKFFPQDFFNKLINSCKEFVNNSNKATKYAGRGLIGAAVLMTLLGNFFTLNNFNKDKGSKTQASTSLIDESKEKVVC